MASRGAARHTGTRLAAGLVAAAAIAGFGAGYGALLGRTGSHAATAGIMLSYFTNLTGLAVAVLFLAIALDPVRALRPRLVAGAVMAVFLVGLVQQGLLAGPRVPRGADQVADIVLHQVLPVVVPLFWLGSAPKGALRYRDPLLWSLYPLAFLAVTLLRGGRTGWYPYPFLDVARLGWPPVLTALAGIATAFLLAGLLVVALDRHLGRRSARARAGRCGDRP